MRQVVQSYKTGALGLWDVPAPAPRAGSVVVSVARSLISAGTEKQSLDLARASLAGKAMSRPDLVRQVIDRTRRDGLLPTLEKVFEKLDAPVALGYSVAGTVEAVGSGVEGLKAGDRVACAGAGHAGHAEFVAVPRNLVVPVPAAVDDEDASFVALGAIALQGVRQAAPTLGERFVVFGLGLLGQLTCQILRANGCQVLGFDPDARKVELARSLGFEAIGDGSLAARVASWSDGHGADGAVITASTKSSEPVNGAAELCRPKGRVVVVGLVGMDLRRDIFYRREIDLRLAMSYGPGRYDPSYEDEGHDYPFAHVRWTEQRNMAAFLRLVGDGQVKLKPLITHRFAIADADRAYALFEGKEPYLGIVLDYPAEAKSPARTVPLRHAKPARAAGNGGLNVAFIGAGNFARAVLMPAFKAATGVRLAAVAATTGVSATHAGNRFGFKHATTDVAGLLSDPAIDAVVIATRHDSHAGLICRALAAGKHVFCEKPLALAPEELAEIAAVEQSAKGVLCLGFNRRFSPAVTQAKAAVAGRTAPLVMMYRVNAGAVPKENWQHGAQGGGRIVGEACHFIDTMTFLAGAPPERVTAQAAKDHPDAVTIQIGFADGSIGTVVYTSLGDPAVPKEYFEIWTSGRCVTIDDYKQMSIVRNGRKSRQSWRRQDKGHAALVAAFVAEATGGAKPATPFDELVAVTEATFVAEASLHQL